MKNSRLEIRLSEQEKERLAQEADVFGLTLSQYARMLLNAKIRVIIHGPTGMSR